jgi:hypothetical protein
MLTNGNNGKIRVGIGGWVCPDCGSWIAGPARDGLVRVRAGTLDDTSWLRPTRHIWTRSKQPWVVFGADDETFETAPPA